MAPAKIEDTICPKCFKEFKTNKARNGHMRWCNLSRLRVSAATSPSDTQENRLPAAARNAGFDAKDWEAACTLLLLSGDDDGPAEELGAAASTLVRLHRESTSQAKKPLEIDLNLPRPEDEEISPI